MRRLRGGFQVFIPVPAGQKRDAAEVQYGPPPQEQPPTPPIHGPAMRELRGIPSGIMSSKVRGRSSSMRGRSSSKGAQQRDQGQRSSRAAQQSAADFEGGAPLASRRGVETGGPAG